MRHNGERSKLSVAYTLIKSGCEAVMAEEESRRGEATLTRLEANGKNEADVYTARNGHTITN